MSTPEAEVEGRPDLAIADREAVADALADMLVELIERDRDVAGVDDLEP